MCPKPFSWAKNQGKPFFGREVERAALSESGTQSGEGFASNCQCRLDSSQMSAGKRQILKIAVHNKNHTSQWGMIDL